VSGRDVYRDPVTHKLLVQTRLYMRVLSVGHPHRRVPPADPMADLLREERLYRMGLSSPITPVGTVTLK
jgi:hypothetical protein